MNHGAAGRQVIVRTSLPSQRCELLGQWVVIRKHIHPAGLRGLLQLMNLQQTDNAGQQFWQHIEVIKLKVAEHAGPNHTSTTVTGADHFRFGQQARRLRQKERAGPVVHADKYPAGQLDIPLGARFELTFVEG